MSTAVSERERQQLAQYKNVHNLLSSPGVQAQISRALPKHLTPERMIRVALTAIQKTPALAECDQRSLIGAIVQAAELGLEPNTPLGHAYLIPYKNNKNGYRLEAQLQIGYRGFIALARRSGEVSSISAEIVYEKDQFEVNYGTNRSLTHKPLLNTKDRGRKLGVYAVVVFKDGFQDFEYMDDIEINAIRARSKSGDSGPWKTDENEMWKKTPIRRLAKRLPLSIEDSALLKAAVTDEYNDTGFGESLLPELPPAPSTITEEQRVALVNAARANGHDLTALVTEFGFEMLADITVDRYDDILNAANVAKPSPAEDQAAPQKESPERSEGDSPKLTKAESQKADHILAIREIETDDPERVAIALDGRNLSDMTPGQVKEVYLSLTA